MKSQHRLALRVCLDWEEDLRGGFGVIWEESVKKVRLFGLRYIIVNLWGKFIEVCEWYDGCKRIFIFFKCVKCKFTNLSFLKKIFK